MLTQGDTHSTEHAGRAVVCRDGIQRFLAFNQVFEKRLFDPARFIHDVA